VTEAAEAEALTSAKAAADRLTKAKRLNALLTPSKTFASRCCSRPPAPTPAASCTACPWR